MNVKLTPEQLEKAATAAREGWCGENEWETLDEKTRENWRDGITAAFAAVEPPQVDAAGDLVERMLDVFIERSERAKMTLSCNRKSSESASRCQHHQDVNILCKDKSKMSIYKQIGAKIRELRVHHLGKGISQKTLAEAMSTTPNTISRWETATYKPSIEDLEKLARYFGTTIGVFFPNIDPGARVQALLSATGDNSGASSGSGSGTDTSDRPTLHRRDDNGGGQN